MSEMSRLRWLCRRGMKELDVVTSRYLERHYADAPAAEQAQFRRLLDMDDPDLYRLLLGQDDVGDDDLRQFAQRLRDMEEK